LSERQDLQEQMAFETSWEQSRLKIAPTEFQAGSALSKYALVSGFSQKMNSGMEKAMKQQLVNPIASKTMP
jgi:hypothetical protein